MGVAYEVLPSTPKSLRARVIDLDPLTVGCDAEKHRERQEAGRAGYESNQRLVICAENGSPIHPQSFSHAFMWAVEKAELRVIRLHNLRHTHATIAVMAGVPVKGVSERLGHESPAFTLKQYAHVVSGMQAEAAERVAEAVGHFTGGSARAPK